MTCEVCKKPYVPEDYNFDSDRKPHECSTCGKGFSLKIQLKRHALLHEGNVPYVCDSCERRVHDATSSYNLRLSKKGDFSCETCGRGFATKRSLLRHAGEHTLESALDCGECGEGFRNATALRRHSAAAHRPRRKRGAKEDAFDFNCEECGSSYSDFTEFELHCASHIKKCGGCSARFSSARAVEDHKKSCCGPPGGKNDTSSVVQEEGSCKHVCNICAKSFTRKSALEGHMFSHFEEEEEENRESPMEDDSDKDVDFKCTNQKNNKPPTTEKPASDSNNPSCLSKPKIRRSLECETCKAVFSSKKLLKKHAVMHEMASPAEKDVPELKKTYTCRVCSCVFDVKEAYKKHKLIHRSVEEASKEKDGATYTCSTCQKVFSKRKHLKKHVRSHCKEDSKEEDKNSKKHKRSKNFACSHCGKRFAGETCMRKHEAKHGGNSNEDSNKEDSINKEDVKSRRTHKKPKPLSCEFCGEDFTGRRQAYVKHKLGHTPEVCGICDARFEDRASLREHCRVHIGTEEGRRFLECSQKALAAKNGLSQPDAKVEYIYLVLR